MSRVDFEEGQYRMSPSFIFLYVTCRILEILMLLVDFNRKKAHVERYTLVARSYIFVIEYHPSITSKVS